MRRTRWNYDIEPAAVQDGNFKLVQCTRNALEGYSRDVLVVQRGRVGRHCAQKISSHTAPSVPFLGGIRMYLCLDAEKIRN